MILLIHKIDYIISLTFRKSHAQNELYLLDNFNIYYLLRTPFVLLFFFPK